MHFCVVFQSCSRPSRAVRQSSASVHCEVLLNSCTDAKSLARSHVSAVLVAIPCNRISVTFAQAQQAALKLGDYLACRQTH